MSEKKLPLNTPDKYRRLSPSEVVHIFSLHSIQEIDRGFITVYGEFSESETDKDYIGFSYHYIIDETTRKKLNAKIPLAVKKTLKSGCCYEFKGVLERRTSKFEELNIYLCFAVTSADNGGSSPVITSRIEEKNLILYSRDEKPRQNIDDLLRRIFRKNEKPRIALLSGEQVKTEPDVNNSIEDQLNCYIPKKKSVNLNSKSQIIDKLKEIDKENYHIIAFYRGGGEMEVLEDNDIARTIIDLKTPIIASFGHSNDRPLAQVAADREFITPSALGTYLRDCADDYVKQNELKNKFEEKERTYQKQISEKDISYETLHNNLTRVLSLHETSQNEIKQLKLQNTELQERNIKDNSTENVVSSFGDFKDSPVFITLVALLLIIGAIAGAGFILGYQYIFSADTSISSSSQTLPVNETVPKIDNNSTNLNNTLNKKQKNNRQK